MSDPRYHIGVLADFNGQNLAGLLQKSRQPAIACELAPYGHTARLLVDQQAKFWKQAYDALVIWTLPEIAVPTFRKVLDCESCSVASLLAEVDAFCDLLTSLPDSVRAVVLPSWVMAGPNRGMGPLDMRTNVGLTNALMQMNLRLVQRLEQQGRVVLLDAQKWVTAAGPGAYNPRLWYLSKTPFHPTVFQEASKDIIAALEGLHGRSKKVLILDLDDTLWGGVVGDLGWEKLRLGGHDAVGEAFVDFQMGLKRLRNRGILLAIASKNEESVALEAIRSHPEMVLREDDFAVRRIDWKDKAENIVELIRTLNLGLDSAVFLDDSPAERARVKEALPQVTVPELPSDPMLYPGFLTQLRYFDNPVVSQEDRVRGRMYVEDRQRAALKTQVKSLDDWLGALELCVRVEPLAQANLDRAAQLLNKTNQMNLSARRLTADQLLSWSKDANQFVSTFRVSDRFGDYGLCGVSSLRHENGKARLVDFLLSCRVMGRRVEETMLVTAARQAKTLGCDELLAEFVPTERNKPCLAWLQGHGRLVQQNHLFRMPLAEELAYPSHVKVAS